MLVKLGVDLQRLTPDIRKVLVQVDEIYNQFAKEEAVLTSTYDGNHSPSSLHYANDAVDFRLPERNIVVVFTAIRGKLSVNKYDVVLESDHIHIEYDPKK